MTGTGQAPSARPPLPSARAGLTPRHTAGAEPVFAELSKGQELFTRTVDLDRGALIAYAAASGDHNPIHWNDRFAREVGLDGVIAHGMLTMGVAGAAVSDWAGDPAAVITFETRFTRPVPVPDPGAATVTVVGTAGALTPDDAASGGGTGGQVRVDLKVTGPDGATVLAKSRATVRLER